MRFVDIDDDCSFVEDENLKRGRRKEKREEGLKGKILGLGIRELVRYYFFVVIAFEEVIFSF